MRVSDVLEIKGELFLITEVEGDKITTNKLDENKKMIPVECVFYKQDLYED